MAEHSKTETSVSEEKYEQYGSQSLDKFSRSLALQEKAVQEIPEGSSSNYRGKSAYAPYPMIYMDDADGAQLTDVDGNTQRTDRSRTVLHDDLRT